MSEFDELLRPQGHGRGEGPGSSYNPGYEQIKLDLIRFYEDFLPDSSSRGEMELHLSMLDKTYSKATVLRLGREGYLSLLHGMLKRTADPAWGGEIL